MNYRLTGSVIFSFMLLFVLLLASCASTQNGAELVEESTATDAEESADTDETTDTDESADTDASEDGAAESSDADFDSDQMAFQLEDTVVTAGDFRERMEEEFGPPIANLLTQGQTPNEIRQLVDQQDARTQLFESMIREKLMVQLAREEGIGVDTDAVDEQVEQQMATQGQMPPGMPDSGEPQPTPNEAEIREEVTERQLVQQLIAAHTTADMHLSRHILLTDTVSMTDTAPVTDTATVTDTDTMTDTMTEEELWDSLYEQAEEISATLQAGEATFEELASEYSEDPGSKDSGGTYGWVPRGQFVPAYEEAAFNAELGEPVIVRSPFGLHIIVVDDREEDRTFDDPEQLFSLRGYETYLQESFIPWYEEQYDEAIEEGTLEVNPDFDPSAVPLPFPEDAPADGGNGMDEEAPADDSGNGMDEEAPADESDSNGADEEAPADDSGNGMDEEEQP